MKCSFFFGNLSGMMVKGKQMNLQPHRMEMNDNSNRKLKAQGKNTEERHTEGESSQAWGGGGWDGTTWTCTQNWEQEQHQTRGQWTVRRKHRNPSWSRILYTNYCQKCKDQLGMVVHACKSQHTRSWDRWITVWGKPGLPSPRQA